MYMDGRDLGARPPLTVGQINLWDDVTRRRVRGRLPHGVRVRVVDKVYYEPEGRWYFCVRRWLRRGWVPGSFVSNRRHEPVGDVV